MVNKTPKGETRQSALAATARPAVSRSVKGVNLRGGLISCGPSFTVAFRQDGSRTRMVQTSLGFGGRFWPMKRPLFQGSRPRGGNREFWVITVVSCEADTLPPPRRVAIDRLR